jgi:hypothetical protein
MRKLYTIIFALIVLFSTAVSVEALESKSMARDNGAYAFADWTETNGDVTTYTYLSVTETDDVTDIYVSVWTCNEITGESSDKYGYMCTEDDVFSIDKKLNSASLSKVDIEVSQWYFDETGEYILEETDIFTVQADWTGIGDVSKGSYKYSSRDGDYVFRGSENSLSRGASVIGSINGNDLGSEYYASMVSFKSASMSMEK